MGPTTVVRIDLSTLRSTSFGLSLSGRTAVLVVVGALLQMASMIPIPFLVRSIFDDVLTDGGGDGPGLVVYGLLVVVLQVVSAGAGVVVRGEVARAAADHSDAVRRGVHELLLTRSISSLRRRDDAELHHLTTDLPMRVEDGVNAVLGMILPAALTAVVVTGVLFVLNWQLAMVLVVAVPLMTAMQRLLRTRVRAANRRYVEESQLLSRRALSAVQRLESVRTAEAATMERATFGVQSARAADRHSRLTTIRAVTMTTNTTAVVLTVTVLLLVGGWAIDQGRLTVGEFLAFYAGVAIVRAPAHQLGQGLPALDQARTARDLLLELDDELERPLDGGTESVELVDGVELRGVRFGYDDGAPVLDGVDLALRRGTVTALVGPNGAGKTTITMLLLGLLRPAAGTIAADGVDYGRLDLADLRTRIGVSFQQAELAEATVADNITYGRAYDPELLAEALDLAGLEAVAADLPDGIDTLVGPGGRRLSRGQEQRIALARAVYGRPPLMVLDEPTNHLDPASVAVFLGKLAGLEHRPAVLVVSHDHRALERADAVLELDGGRLQARSV